MSKALKLILLITGVAAAGSAAYYFIAGKGNNLLAYIPKDAALVVKIDIPKIAETFKEYESEVSQYGILKDKKVSREEPLLRILQAISQDPANSGLGFSDPAYMYVDHNMRGTGIGLLFSLRDSRMFEQLIKKYIAAGGANGVADEVGYAEIEAGIFLSWKDKTGLMTINKAEGKNYPLEIFRKMDPKSHKEGAIHELSQSKKLIAGILRIDPLFDKTDTGSFKNPFAPGSAFTMELDLDKTVIRQEYAFVSGDKKQKGLGILKSSGNYKKYRGSLFSREIPLYAFSASFDLPGIQKLFNSISSKPASLPLFNMFFEIAGRVWNGDISFGLSYDKEQKDTAGAYDEFPNPAIPANFGIVAHIGLGDSAVEALEPYLRNTTPVEEQINEISPGTYIAVTKDELVFSTDLDALKSIVKGTYTSGATGFKDMESHTGSPLYIALDGTRDELNQLPQNAMFPESFEKMMQGMKGYNYIWVENNKLISELQMKDNRTHPFIHLLRLAEELYLMEKNGGNPFVRKNASLVSPRHSLTH